MVLCCLEHHDFESELKYRLKPPLPFLMGCGVGVQLDTLIMLDSTQIGDFEFKILLYSENLIYQSPIVLSNSSNEPISQKCWISRAYFRGRLLEGNRSVRGVTCGERVTETCYTRHLTPGRQSLCVQYACMLYMWLCFWVYIFCGCKVRNNLLCTASCTWLHLCVCTATHNI